MGGKQLDYCASGYNHRSIYDYLLRIRQTADTCGMRYMTPLVMFGMHSKVIDSERQGHLEAYENWLRANQENTIQPLENYEEEA